MATTNEWQCSGTTCMLLLPQLVKNWLPKHRAARRETDRCSKSELAPRSQIPPLVSFLEDLSDVATSDETKCKKLSCGHPVTVRSILVCANFFGDAPWTTGGSFLACAEPDCTQTVEFPKLPDPRVLDGLRARLDLIQWSWNKDEPTERDMNTVGLLRDMLTNIKNLDQEPEPENDADLALNAPSKYSLTRTLIHMELEAISLMTQSKGKSTEISLRGTEPYCSYRAALEPRAGHFQRRYSMPSSGQDCTCLTAHEYEREPRAWALTPAEAAEPDLDEQTEDVKGKKRKTVRFVASVVTEVQYFEPWWCDEYRDSDRYWSMGPYRRSMDLSTPADDESEIERLQDPEGWAAKMAREVDGEESDCGAGVGDDDGYEGDFDEAGKASELWDEETLLDEIEVAGTTSDDESEDDLIDLHESWGDQF